MTDERVLFRFLYNIFGRNTFMDERKDEGETPKGFSFFGI